METVKKVIVFTGQNDPMWPFLIEACSMKEQAHIRLFETDNPCSSRIEYDPIQRTGRLTIQNETIESENVRAIWLRRFVPPNLHHFSQELRDYCEREYADFFLGGEYAFDQAVWVSKPSAIEFARNKARQLFIAGQIGFVLPKTLFTNSPESLVAFCGPTESIYKAIRSPRIPLKKDRYTSVFTSMLDEDAIKKKDGIMSCPGILQNFIRKKADVRVTVFGKKIFAVYIDSQSVERSRIDFRIGAKYLSHLNHSLPSDIEQKCIQLVEDLGLLYGAIDLALMEDGSYVFFEINPNGQWGWLEIQLGIPMRRALLDILFQS